MAWQAFGWAALAAAALLVGAGLATTVPVSRRAVGLIMAFGSGVLISAVAYELVAEAFHTVGLRLELAAGLVAGAVTFFAGDTLVSRLGGADRKRSHGRQAGGSALAIVLGTVLDGIPESVVLGLSLRDGGAVSVTVLVAVALSNLPESLAATTGLRAAGWRGGTILGMWSLVVLVCGLAGMSGVVLLAGASPVAVAFTLGFAAGAILTMLADTMMPEAFEQGGKLVGLLTTCGFGLAAALSALG